MTTVLYHAKVGGSAKLVLIGIANHEGDGGAYPSIDTLARYANIDRRQTQRILRQLEDQGLLASTMRYGYSTLYRVTVQCPENCDRTTNHRLIDRGGVGVTPDILGGGVDDTGRGGVNVTGGAVYTPPEPSITVNLTKEAESFSELAFQEFWQLYPKKVDYAGALKVFVKLTPEEKAKAPVAAGDYANSVEAENIKYVPYAANWLQKKRFNDDFTLSPEIAAAKRREQEKAQLEAQRIEREKQREENEKIRANGGFKIPACKYDETINILHCGHTDCNE